MRSLRWVVTCTVLLAAGTAFGAEPVKIRASWIVAPSDWTPLLLEKPELMKNNGKTYAFEPQRFQGTPAVITALAISRIPALRCSRLPDRAELAAILRQGLPVGLHMMAEVGVFAMAGLLPALGMLAFCLATL